MATPAADDAAVDTSAAKFLDQYSRQIGTFGLETMVRLVSLKVIISGCTGAGVEAAKNLSLAGVHTISLHDPAIPSITDCGVNFALTPQHVDGTATRAQVTARLIAELNPTTRVRVITDVDEAALQNHDVIIVTTSSPFFRRDALHSLNERCRSRISPATGAVEPVSLLVGAQAGVFASIFVDHGRGFITTDGDGRAPLQKAIVQVSTRADKKGKKYSLVRFVTPEGQTPGAFRDVTCIRFSEVVGLTRDGGAASINGEVHSAVVGKDDPPNSVRLYPSLEERGYSPYESLGFVVEEKETIRRNFRSLKRCLDFPPPIINTNWLMDGSAENTGHLCLAALLEFTERSNGQLPALHSRSDAEELLRIARDIVAAGKDQEEDAEETDTDASPTVLRSESAVFMVTLAKEDDELPTPLPPPPRRRRFFLESVDEEAVRQCALFAAAELQPFGAVLGAILAQEVVKITGKFTPIDQLLHLQCRELLPGCDSGAAGFDWADLAVARSAAATAPVLASRYDHLIALLGRRFVERLMNLNVFMVGCGALGCEDLKNFALCGICCGDTGKLTVTDNDRIEVSNLNRQFLFREDNVGQPKTVAAARRVATINPAIKINALQDFVSAGTEDSFPDSFWIGLDSVVNALDNIPARLYVDAQCVLHNKVLVETGTMGTGGNVDIIVPHKTSSYADGGAADEAGGIPMCTLRNFPYLYDHCIEWSRAQFEDMFVSPVVMVNQAREDPARFVAKCKQEVADQESHGARTSVMLKQIKSLQQLLRTATTLSKTPTMQDCVAMAWEVLHVQFRDRIVNLIRSFPRDATKKNGEAFWSGHRRFPTPVDASTPERVLSTTPDLANFLITTANLFACMYGIHPPKHAPRYNKPEERWMAQYRSEEWLRGCLATLTPPPVQASRVDDLDDDSAGAAAPGGQGEVDEAQTAQLHASLLEQCLALGTTVAGPNATAAQPLDFEKDDDDNFHIDFVAAASNLRAINYGIPTGDRLKVKMVAGKIIPAIATTTAAVTGFSLIEWFKVLLGRPTSDLRNGMLDIGVNNYVMFDRDAPKQVKTAVLKTYDAEHDYTEERRVVAFPNPHTKYDRIEIPNVGPTTTIEEVVAALQAKTESAEGGPYVVVALGVGKGQIWNGLPKHANYKRPALDVIRDALLFESPQLAAKVEKNGLASFWGNRAQFSRLAVNMETEDGDEVVNATVVLLIVQ